MKTRYRRTLSALAVVAVLGSGFAMGGKPTGARIPADTTDPLRHLAAVVPQDCGGACPYAPVVR